MRDKGCKWLEHLKAAEASQMSLNAYAKSNQINVQRLYEARRFCGFQAHPGIAVTALQTWDGCLRCLFLHYLGKNSGCAWMIFFRCSKQLASIAVPTVSAMMASVLSTGTAPR